MGNGVDNPEFIFRTNNLPKMIFTVCSNLQTKKKDIRQKKTNDTNTK